LTQDLRAAGTTSAAFLRLGSGARAVGMGETFAALADDASATHWNPAGLSQLTRRELLAEHTVHIQEIAIQRLAYAHPLKGPEGRPSRHALALSAAYLSLNGIEARTGNTTAPDRVFGASDFVGAVSYARPLSAGGRATRLGITGKVIRQSIDTHTASAYAMDIGVMDRLGSFQWGLVLANLGSNVRFVDESFPLPQALRFGVALRSPRLPMTVATGMEKTKGDSFPSYRLGLEYGVSDNLALRAGYVARGGASQRALRGRTIGTISNSDFSKFTGLVGGLGFRLFGYGLDYAFTPFGELGNAHQISLSAKFK